jgi:hypothetical protein
MTDTRTDCHAVGALYPTRASLEAAWVASKSKSNAVLRCWTTKKARRFKSSKTKNTGKREFTFDDRTVIWADELATIASPIPSLSARLGEDPNLVLMSRRAACAVLDEYLKLYYIVGAKGNDE